MDNDWSNSANWAFGAIPTDISAHNADFRMSVTANEDLVLDQNQEVGTIDFNGSSKNIILGVYDLKAGGIVRNSTSGYVRTTGTGVLEMNVRDGMSVLFPVGNSNYNPVEIKK